MEIRDEREIEAQEKKNRATLLAAEATALALLLRQRNGIVARGIERDIGAAHIAQELVPGIRRGVLTARQLTRQAALSRLRSEAASVGFELSRLATVLTSQALLDVYRATAVAKSYSTRWLKHAIGDSLEEAAATAEAATAGSLRRIAVTESAQSFNSSRLAAVQSIARHTALFRRWDAMLDACPICWAANGSIVPAADSFPAGEPGSVHPFCRCTFTLLSRTELESEAA